MAESTRKVDTLADKRPIPKSFSQTADLDQSATLQCSTSCTSVSCKRRRSISDVGVFISGKTDKELVIAVEESLRQSIICTEIAKIYCKAATFNHWPRASLDNAVAQIAGSRCEIVLHRQRMRRGLKRPVMISVQSFTRLNRLQKTPAF